MGDFKVRLDCYRPAPPNDRRGECSLLLFVAFQRCADVIACTFYSCQSRRKELASPFLCDVRVGRVRPAPLDDLIDKQRYCLIHLDRSSFLHPLCPRHPLFILVYKYIRNGKQVNRFNVNLLTLSGYRSMIVVYSSAIASIGEQVNKTSLNLLPKSYRGFRRNTQNFIRNEESNGGKA